ncbi:MAG: fumarate reductase subunit FrdD [Candidatus Dormiibacterota bacterium]
MSEHAAKKPHTAYAHLFWWFMFAQGGAIAAMFLPIHILVQGILGPLNVVEVVDRHYDTWIKILGNPIVKLYLLVLIAVPFFHFAHRLRYLLVDLGVPAAKTTPAQVIFYGAALLVTLATIWVLLTTAPLSFG